MAPPSSPERLPIENKRESAIIERMKSVETVMLPENAEALRSILFSPPNDPVLLMPGPERDALRDEFKALTQERSVLLGTLEPMLQKFEQPTDSETTKELGALFQEIVSAYESRVRSYTDTKQRLIQQTAKSIADEIGLPATDILLLSRHIEYRVTPLLGTASKDIIASQEALSDEQVPVLKAFALLLYEKSNGEKPTQDTREQVKGAWLSFREKAIAYDEKAESAGVTQFADILGLEGTTVNDARRFIDEATAPLASLDRASKDVQKNPRVVALGKKLEYQRRELTVILPSLLRNGCDPSEKEKWSWFVTEYLLNRGAYQSAVIGQVDTNNQWMMYGTIVMQELLEEGAEAIPQLEIGKRLTFLRGIVGPVRLQILKGLRDAYVQLEAQGISGKMLGKVLDMFGRSPLGPKFWTELFKVESAATILLWGLYLHNSPNKFRASVQFGSFIALSNAVSKLSTPVMEALGVLKLAGKIPTGNFALQFGVAMAAAFVAADKIQAFSKWVDETIPDSSLKSQGTVALGIVSGEPIFSGIEEISDASGLTGVLDKVGMTGFDPDRDLMDYLGTEAVTVDWKTLEADYRRIHTIHDWNDRLQQAIASQDNEIQKGLWDTLHIDQGTWSAREALKLFSAVSLTRRMEDSFAEELHKAGVFNDAEKLRGSEIATTDSEKKEEVRWQAIGITIGDDLRNRNDRLMARAFDWDPALVKAGKHYNKLPDSNPSKQAWKEYVQTCTDIAKNVGIYRHVGVYSRDQWLGPFDKLGKSGGLGSMSEMVRQGLLHEVRHQMHRRTLLSAETYPKLTKPEFLRKLVGTVKLKEKYSFLEEGFMILTKPQEYQGMDRHARDQYFKLMFVVQDAQKSLPDRMLEAALQPLREIILAGKVPSSADLGAVHAALNSAIIEHEMKGEPIKEASKDIREDLELSSDIPLFFQGPASAATYHYTRKKINLNWFLNATETEFTEEMRVFKNLKMQSQNEFKNLHFVRARDDEGFFRHYQHHSFDCPTSDRKTWRVNVQQLKLTTRHFKREDGVDYVVAYSLGRDPEQTVPFSDWLSVNMEVAIQLEPALKKIQQVEREKELKKVQEKEQETLEKRVVQSESFLYFSALRGDIGDPASLPPVPASLANDKTFVKAYERQNAMAKEWKDLKRGGLLRVFEEWGKLQYASQMSNALQIPLGRNALPKSEVPSIVAVHNAMVAVRPNTSWQEDERFLSRCIDYVRNYAEQREFLKKNPISRP